MANKAKASKLLVYTFDSFSLWALILKFLHRLKFVEVEKRYGLKLKGKPVKYEAIILAVSHEVFISEGLNKYKSSLDSIIYDVKSVLSKEEIDDRL